MIPNDQEIVPDMGAQFRSLMPICWTFGGTNKLLVLEAPISSLDIGGTNKIIFSQWESTLLWPSWQPWPLHEYAHHANSGVSGDKRLADVNCLSHFVYLVVRRLVCGG